IVAGQKIFGIVQHGMESDKFTDDPTLSAVLLERGFKRSNQLRLPPFFTMQDLRSAVTVRRHQIIVRFAVNRQRDFTHDERMLYGSVHMLEGKNLKNPFFDFFKQPSILFLKIDILHPNAPLFSINERPLLHLQLRRLVYIPYGTKVK